MMHEILWLAASSIISLSIVFGEPIKKLLLNIIAYYDIVFINRSCKLGDVVEVCIDGKNFIGRIDGMTLETVKLKNVRGHVIFLRYSDLSSRLINYSYQDSYANIELHLPHHVDTSIIISLMDEIDEELKRKMPQEYANEVKKDGIIAIYLTEAIFRYRFKTKPGRQWKIEYYVYTYIHNRLRTIILNSDLPSK